MLPTWAKRSGYALLLVFALLITSATSAVADDLAVETGYSNDAVVDVIWAAQHLNYGGPGDLQKAGVQVLRFLLVAIAGATDDGCDAGLGASLDPSGPYRYTSTWADEEVDALQWVRDHYCLTSEQSQLLGGSVLAFLAGLDASLNGTDVLRSDAPPTPTAVPPTTGVPSTQADPSRPGRMDDLTVTAGLGKASLQWSPPEVLGGTDTTYTVRYRQSFPAPHPLFAEPSIDGRILFMSDRDGDWDLYTMNADGTGVHPLTDNTVEDWSGDYSPDGTQVVFDGDHGNGLELFAIGIDGSNLRALTDNEHDDAFPAWSPDGSRIAFQSNRAGDWEIFTMGVGGTDVDQLTAIGVGDWAVPAWSPDGTRIAFSGIADGDAELYVVPVTGGVPTQLTVNEGISDRWPQWSPDGTRIVFESDRDGDWEIFTMAADGSDVQQVTWNDDYGDTEPAWSPDGSRIAFTRVDSGTSEVFLVNSNGTDLLGPVTIGEQPTWAPADSNSREPSVSNRVRHIVTGQPSIRTPLVVGGDEVEVANYSFQLAIIHATHPNAYHGQFCGATLVRSQWVVTAAHCVEAEGGGFILPSEISVAAGRTRLKEVLSSDRYEVAAVYPHPSYDREEVINDIALLRLSKPIPGSIATPLPWNEDPLSPIDGTPILKVGWGSEGHIEEGPFPDKLKAVTVNVFGDPGYEFCSTADEFDSLTQICTGSAAHKGACSGDSGGPNIIDIDGFWYLAGVTSYGMTDDTNLCGDDVDVITRISTYTDWIVDHVGHQWTWVTGITDTFHEISGLENGWTYTFQVKAENDLGAGPYSLPATTHLSTPVTAAYAVPEQPTNVQLSSGDRSVTLTWEPAEPAEADDPESLTYTVVHYEPSMETPSDTTLSRPTADEQVGEHQALPTIVGGTVASSVDHPYIVPLLDAATEDANDAYSGAGTLVAPRWVVTAAHRVYGLSPSDIQTVAGISDLGEVTAADRIEISNIYIHEGFRGDTDDYTHNVALLRLSDNVTASNARWIPWQTDSSLPLIGTTLKVAGWGASVTEGSNQESRLRESSVMAIGSPGEDRCGVWNLSPSGFDSAHWLCVGGEQGVGSCNGDGGGPVVADLGMTRLVGVTAIGLAGSCADLRYPNVATRVSTYAPWISARVGEPWREVAGLTENSYTVGGLTNDQEYRFYLSAVDALGRSSAPVVVTATPGP